MEGLLDMRDLVVLHTTLQPAAVPKSDCKFNRLAAETIKLLYGSHRSRTAGRYQAVVEL
jgi:hypothetical protein